MTRVLKGGAAAGGRRIEAEVFDAAARARELVARAEAEATAIRAVAEADAARVRAEADALGRAEGLARAAATLVEAARARDRRLAAVEREVLALAVEVARKILGRELALAPGAVLDVVREALAAARDRREVALRVNPADATAVRAGADALARTLARAEGLAVREDPAVPAGGVVVETEAGLLDARLETQLALLRAALEEAAP